MEPSTPVSFGLALEAMKDGKKVRRKVWRSDLHRSIKLCPGDAYSYPKFTELRGNDTYYWLPRHGDLIAEDWEVLA